MQFNDNDVVIMFQIRHIVEVIFHDSYVQIKHQLSSSTILSLIDYWQLSEGALVSGWSLTLHPTLHCESCPYLC